MSQQKKMRDYDIPGKTGTFLDGIIAENDETEADDA